MALKKSCNSTINSDHMLQYSNHFMKFLTHYYQSDFIKAFTSFHYSVSYEFFSYENFFFISFTFLCFYFFNCFGFIVLVIFVKCIEMLCVHCNMLYKNKVLLLLLLSLNVFSSLRSSHSHFTCSYHK